MAEHAAVRPRAPVRGFSDQALALSPRYGTYLAIGGLPEPPPAATRGRPGVGETEVQGLRAGVGLGMGDRSAPRPSARSPCLSRGGLVKYQRTSGGHYYRKGCSSSSWMYFQITGGGQ